MKKLLSMKTRRPALKARTSGVILVFLATLLFATEVGATTLTVTNLNDSGAGSLRDTIAAASSGDEIHFGVTGTINLTSGELRVLKNLNIIGPGADQLTIQRSLGGGTPAFRLFYISNGAYVDIDRLTLTNGLVTDSVGNGGCIYNDGGFLQLFNCYVHDNTATNNGGAIFNNGAGSGRSANVDLFGCTLEGNHAANGDGGAVYNSGDYSGTAGMIVVNTTFFRNTAGIAAGAIYNIGKAQMDAHLCTFAKNYSYGGSTASTIQTYGAQSKITLSNTIINSDLSETLGERNGAIIESLDYNLGRTQDRAFLTGPHDQLTADYPLDPAGTQPNGGPVPTIAVLSGPAVDGGNTPFNIDARGRKRPFDQPGVPNAAGGNGSDIGAYEADDRLQPGLHVVVNTLDDHDDGTCGLGDCTLREAIARMSGLRGELGTSVGPYQISFLPTGTITLKPELGELKVTSGVEITGPGARDLAISGNAQHRVFSFSSPSSRGAVVVSGVTISDGINFGVTPGGGPGIGGGLVNSGVLILNECHVINNHVGGAGNSADGANGGDGLGGGICNVGTLTVNRCLIGNNYADGAPGNVSPAIGSFSHGGNGGSALGAGIFNSGDLTVNNSTLVANVGKGGNGGRSSNGGNGGNGVAGIYNTNKVVLTACTISSNVATGGEGGAPQGKFAGNPGTPGIDIAGLNGGSTTVRNTIVAGNLGRDTNGAFTSSGYNLIGVGDFSSGFNGPADQVGTTAKPIDPKLGDVDHSTGTTDTIQVLAGSPAIDAGNSFGLTTDQRGFHRPIDLSAPNASDGSDIGAVEASQSLDPTPTATPTATPIATPTATATPASPTVLANISTRLRVATGDNVLIGGFIVTGTQPKKVLLRAIGPSLPVSGALANPVLELHDGTGSTIFTNDNWKDTQQAQIEATTIPPGNDLESAIVATLPANASSYTAVVKGMNGGTGVGLVEVYDLDRSVDSKLANISTRGRVQTGDNVMIAGTIILGQAPQKVIIRAIGPSLGITGRLANPTLELRDGNGGLIRANDDWRIGGQEAEIIASTVPPANDSESAIVETLASNGATYTAIVRGANNTTGIALVEVYALQ